MMRDSELVLVIAVMSRYSEIAAMFVVIVVVMIAWIHECHNTIEYI